jgi:hypothetical protein
MNLHIVNLEVYFGTESGIFASGVLIDNFHILTLASNLYNRRSRRPANKINIYETKNKTQYFAKSIHIPQSYYKDDPSNADIYQNFDYSIIKLKDEVKNIDNIKINSIPYKELIHKEVIIIASPVHFIQKHGLIRNPPEFFIHTVTNTNYNNIFYNKDIRSEIAGSPIFMDIDGVYILIGLHYGGVLKKFEVNSDDDVSCETDISCGIRVTDEMLQFIKSHTSR